jgi:hypothetical protein
MISFASASADPLLYNTMFLASPAASSKYSHAYCTFFEFKKMSKTMKLFVFLAVALVDANLRATLEQKKLDIGVKLKQLQDGLAAARAEQPRFGNKDVGWVFGDSGETCTKACDDAGGSCNLAATKSLDTAAKLKYVVEEELNQAVGTYEGGEEEIDPAFVIDENVYHGSFPTATCDSSEANHRRICCCSDDSSNCPVA